MAYIISVSTTVVHNTAHNNCILQTVFAKMLHNAKEVYTTRHSLCDAVYTSFALCNILAVTQHTCCTYIINISTAITRKW